jgi:hypothetical protein
MTVLSDVGPCRLGTYVSEELIYQATECHMLVDRIWLPSVVGTPTLNNCERSAVDTASRGWNTPVNMPRGILSDQKLLHPFRKVPGSWLERQRASVDTSTIRGRGKRGTPPPYNFISGTVRLFCIFHASRQNRIRNAAFTAFALALFKRLRMLCRKEHVKNLLFLLKDRLWPYD